MLGHPWPPGLVENLVLQCEGRIGALPLLQYALQQLWPEHVTGRLAESRWSSRLIEDFVVQRADELYEGSRAGPEREVHQRIVRRAFVSMVQLGEGAADTRRVARLSEIVARHETPDRDKVTAAAFSPDGERVVTASNDRTARVWDARTGKAMTELVHRDKVTAAAFSPDGSRVVTATGSEDHTARVWDARTGQPVAEPLEHRDTCIGSA